MTALTATQISDLNNSMVAAQNISMGTLLGSLASNMVDGGVAVPTASPFTVVTGLSEITSVTCSLAGSPTINHHMSTVASGSVAGTIVISSWKPTSTSNPTPVAASGSFVNVNWIAVGL